MEKEKWGGAIKSGGVCQGGGGVTGRIMLWGSSRESSVGSRGALAEVRSNGSMHNGRRQEKCGEDFDS